jgi:hypothetical protein
MAHAELEIGVVTPPFQGYTHECALNFIEKEAKTAGTMPSRLHNTNTVQHGLQHTYIGRMTRTHLALKETYTKLQGHITIEEGNSIGSTPTPGRSRLMHRPPISA